jgi:trehalose 6-phosphate synthase
MVRSSPPRSSNQEGSDPLHGRDLIVVSNREPYSHRWEDGEIVVRRPNGGLTNGLNGVMRKVGGTWIAWGDGDADEAVVDDRDRVTVPPDAGEEDGYMLERVWLSEDEVENYYLGFSNRVLWPICHSALTRVESKGKYWEAYRDVNRRFADRVADQVNATSDGDAPVVWIQDYHFALAPGMIRERVGEAALLSQFWHIPWPGADTFRACPHGEELVRGLLGNDVLGFHLERYCESFLGTVEAMVEEASVDRDAMTVSHPGGTLSVEALPLGVEADRIRSEAETDDGSGWRRFAEEYGVDPDVRVTLGVDRLDYTKGIPERIRALGRLWETHPELRGDFSHVQIGTESRSEIPVYDELQSRVQDAVDEVNGRFGTDEWTPVHYTTDHIAEGTLYAVYRRADVALVSPIRDGMNLVALEYVASQVDGDGVLVLSPQAGVHDHIGDDVVTATPQSTDEFAEAIREALTMPEDERRRRMRSLQRYVHRNDLDAWIDAALDNVTEQLAQGRKA